MNSVPCWFENNLSLRPVKFYMKTGPPINSSVLKTFMPTRLEVQKN